MGTHPIFESDFDCLTVMNRIVRGLSTTPLKLWRQQKQKQARSLLDSGDAFWRDMSFGDWIKYGSMFSAYLIGFWYLMEQREGDAIANQSTNPYNSYNEKRKLADLSAMELYRLEQDAKYILKHIDDKTYEKPEKEPE